MRRKPITDLRRLGLPCPSFAPSKGLGLGLRARSQGSCPGLGLIGLQGVSVSAERDAGWKSFESATQLAHAGGYLQGRWICTRRARQRHLERTSSGVAMGSREVLSGPSAWRRFSAARAGALASKPLSKLYRASRDRASTDATCEWRGPRHAHVSSRQDGPRPHPNSHPDAFRRAEWNDAGSGRGGCGAARR